MSYDIYVRWDRNKSQPTKEEAHTFIKRFFGAALAGITWTGSDFLVLLVGEHSYMTDVAANLLKTRTPGLLDESRVMEITAGHYHVCITTRMADEFTNACAWGLANAFAAKWEGRVDTP